MKKSIRLIMIAPFAAVGFLLAACSSDTDEPMLKDSAPELKLTAEVDEGTKETRASSSLQTTAIVSNQEVGVYLVDGGSSSTYKTSYDGAHTNLQYTAGNNGALTPGSTQYFPADGNTLNIYAYAPYNSTSAVPITKTGFSWTCNSDQTSQANYLASDLLMTAKTSVARSSNAVSLTFNHVMTKITVKLIAGNGMDLSTVTDVRLKNVAATGTFNISSMAASSYTASTTAATIQLK